MFDPWMATLDDAMIAQQKCYDNSSDISPADPIFQFCAAHEVTSLRKIVEDGDGFTVLECVQKCLNHGLIAPAWLSYAFNRHYYPVLNCRAKSWDDPISFGAPYPKGTNIKARKKRRELRFAVYQEIKKILKQEPDTPVDETLFERAGKNFSIGKTLASEYYYEAKKNYLISNKKIPHIYISFAEIP